MSQIRIQKTPELVEVLDSLKRKYRLLTEAEIIKMVLSEKSHELEQPQNQDIKQAWKKLKSEGKKLGDKLLAEKGLKREDVTEQQFHDLFLNDHSHNA